VARCTRIGEGRLEIGEGRLEIGDWRLESGEGRLESGEGFQTLNMELWNRGTMEQLELFELFEQYCVLESDK